MQIKTATIHLYQAIAMMRELSAKNETFAFSFATYNRSTGQCHGMTSVKQARIRPSAKSDDVTNADFKLFYFDETTQLPKVCWQPLVMYFNGFKVTL